MEVKTNRSKKDLELETNEVEKLFNLQEERQKKFQSKIEAAKKDALQKYTERIKMLSKAKEEAVKNYEEEIEKYQHLIKSIREQNKKVKRRGKGTESTK